MNVIQPENFDFYNKELTEFEFLNKFYIWETEFWGKDDGNVEIEKIEEEGKVEDIKKTSSMFEVLIIIFLINIRNDIRISISFVFIL